MIQSWHFYHELTFYYDKIKVILKYGVVNYLCNANVSKVDEGRSVWIGRRIKTGYMNETVHEKRINYCQSGVYISVTSTWLKQTILFLDFFNSTFYQKWFHSFWIATTVLTKWMIHMMIKCWFRFEADYSNVT